MMRAAAPIVALAGFFRGSAALNITLSSKLFSDNSCKHQFKTVPSGPIELGQCQFGDGAHVLYECMNDSHLHLTLNLGGKDCSKGTFTYEADLVNGECSPLHPLGFASGIWSWTGGCGAEASGSAANLGAAAPTPCCQGACKTGEQKYWSIADGFFGDHHCGECCMDPKQYDLFHFFEKNLTPSNHTITPCKDFGYTEYDSTPTHGVWPAKMTLDLYNKPGGKKPESTPCCQGACKTGEAKYWSIAKGMLGDEHCGECCMDPSTYDVFHFFEKNLTRAQSTMTPCKDFGYTAYDSTPTHGVWPVTMTLDLYDKPKARNALVV